jgi:cell division protein FtsQ
VTTSRRPGVGGGTRRPPPVTAGRGRGRGRGRSRGPAIGGVPGEAGLANVVDVDPRIEARRAEVRLTRLARRRRQWLAGSVAVTVLVLLYGVTRTAVLDVDDVVVAGAVRTPAGDVRAASAVRPGDPLTDVDGDRAVAAVQGLPWVDTATVTRSWTGSVDITVTERQPAVAVEGEAGVGLVDGRRRVLVVDAPGPSGRLSGESGYAGDLLLVRGVPVAPAGETMPPAFDGALALAGAMPPGLRSRVVAVEVAGDELRLALRPRGTARVGTVDRLDQKLVALSAMFGQVSLDDLCVVDVSVPAAPVLTRDDPCG